ncbi:MAG: magnesium/cobalt transporter CorA [Proteobacteria bacterium]|nr:magnesium/cobalt transporter CorA [Pseudomonadota bacterium]
MTVPPLPHPIPGHRPRRTPPGAPPGTLVVDPAAAAPTIALIAYGPEALTEEQDIAIADIDGLRETHPVLWLDISGLGDVRTLRDIGEKFGLHSLALEDVLNVNQRPKIDEYDDHLFIVCRMPHNESALETEQVSFFLGKDFVITMQERPGDCFEPVRNRLRTKRGRIRAGGADYLIYALLDAVTDAFFPVLESIGEQIGIMEEEIIGDPMPEDVHRIHALKRDLLTVRRAVWPQREMLSAMIRDESLLIQEQTKLYLRDCFDHTFQLIDLIETYREIVSDLTDIFLSAQSTRMNEVMKVLTVIATIFMPLTLISGIYGMNFSPEASPWNMPELHAAYGYPVVIGVMIAITVGMLAWFRNRGWIGRRPRRKKRFRTTFQRRPQ